MFFRPILSLFACCASLCLVHLETDHALADESLLAQMTGDGVKMTDGVSVKLAPPLILDGLTSAQRDDLAGNFGWDRFSRDSVVAPVWMNLQYIKNDSQQRMGHLIHFRFIVHESLDRLRDRDLMSDLFSGSTNNNSDTAADSPDEGSFRDLSAEQLEPNALPSAESMHYGFTAVPLMNRVMLRGVIAAQSVDLDSSVVLAWRLLDSIDQSEPYAARWSPLERDSVGNQVEGPARSYQGAAGYLHLQSLSAIDSSLDSSLDQACLIEARIVLHEPQDWFGGSNFLRSKFPLLIQEAVRKFRRGLSQR